MLMGLLVVIISVRLRAFFKLGLLRRHLLRNVGQNEGDGKQKDKKKIRQQIKKKMKSRIKRTWLKRHEKRGKGVFGE